MSMKGKTTFDINDFLTRAEKLAKVEVPSSNKKVVIVKANNEGIGFRFDCYPKELLLPDIKKGEFDQTVLHCHKICEKTFLEKKKEEDAEYNSVSKKLLYLGILLVLTALILLIVRVYGPSEDGLLITALILIGVTIAMTVVIVIKMYFTSPHFINLEEVSKHKLKAFLDQENRNYYRPKGYEWRMEPHYYWLELHNLKDVRETSAMLALKTVRVNTENDPLYETLQTEER